jgi:ribonucleoside-diphosphate reductase alpha chain|tara:strand:+ start:2217 stop:4124 length:1908 start_codon:yes stop_codon:yes gene_type:complete
MAFEVVEGSLGHTIFDDKYVYPGETKWNQLAKRVARTAADPEFPEDRERIQQLFYDAINAGDFCPGGRILFGSGRSNQNMLNCYVLDPEDSVESIGKLISDVYKISCGGGGIGFNFSKIRPKGDDIQNIRHSAPGSISVMRMINEIGNHVRAGKNRRTALMSILEVSHPDFLEFLHVKLDRKELTNFNISVAVTSRFLEAVENEEEWYFTFSGRQNKYYQYVVDRVHAETGAVEQVRVVAKDEEDALGRAQVHHLAHFADTFKNAVKEEIKARDLWERIVDNAIESGEPGIFNIDFSNEYTNVSYFEHMPATNPCGEEVLPAYGNCCLGHVNLANMVKPDGKVDWSKLKKTIKVGVRFLDNILTANHFPIPECATAGSRSRRVGLGITGLHYFLIKTGYRYGSEECLEEVARLFETIRNEAYKASMRLAKDKGSFPEFSWEKLKKESFFKTLPSHVRQDIKKHGLRNAILLTVAPTGTISMVLGVSTGLEPIFAPVYKRRWRTGSEGVWNETIVMDPLFKQYLDAGKSVEHIVGAYDVTPEEHIKMQATVQKYIDSAVSKTCNLPADFESKTLYDEILSYIHEMKGITFYKAGSRGNEPLEALALNTLDLDKLREDGIIEQVESVDSCKSGVCEL